MRGPILSLLLISGVAAAKQHGESDPFHKAGTNGLRRGSFPGCDGIHCTSMSMSKGLTDVHRHKRALLASFKLAWAKLVASTYGFRWIQVFGVKIKFFAKVGTTDDAFKDFYSLRPTGVRREGFRLVGQVGNQEVVLSQPSPDLPPVLNLEGRQIVYAETADEAQFFLQKFRNVEMIKPTLH